MYIQHVQKTIVVFIPMHPYEITNETKEIKKSAIPEEKREAIKRLGYRTASIPLELMKLT